MVKFFNKCCAWYRIVWTYNAPVSGGSERTQCNGSAGTSNSTSISDGISQRLGHFFVRLFSDNFFLQNRFDTFSSYAVVVHESHFSIVSAGIVDASCYNSILKSWCFKKSESQSALALIPHE